MNRVTRWISIGVTGCMLNMPAVYAQNQTPDISPILTEAGVPYRVQIESAGFTLPNGLQSFESAVHQGRWLLLAGRINGLHDFGTGNDNFPANQQNTTVFVVDPALGTVATRSLADAGAGLTQAQIDLLSVTSAQSYQSGDTLYLAGGYGVDTALSTFSTKDALSAIDVPGLMRWVVDALPGDTAAQHIRQIHDPIFQVTGGAMVQGASGVTLLMLGQDFVGSYVPASNGIYTQQVRRFRISDDGTNLGVTPLAATPAVPDPNLRRRDLNIVPTMRAGADAGWTAWSGVFTLGNGAWTVPVDITRDGTPSMADPAAPTTFKQGMNGYASAHVEFYSQQLQRMYSLLMGGISYAYVSGGVTQTDAGLPFINQVTTIARDDNTGLVTQHLMTSEYPLIPSTGSNPGNALLFGAGAKFFPADGIARFANGVLDSDQLGRQPRTLGYIVGGIMSTLPNTGAGSDSAASPYVFRVVVRSLVGPPASPVPALPAGGLVLLSALVALGAWRMRQGVGGT